MRIPITTDDDYPERSGKYDIIEEGSDMGRKDEYMEEAGVRAEEREQEESAEAWKHRCLCMKADFDNYRKHAEAERDRLAETGKESVLAELFPIAEHLERAVAEAKKRKANSGIVKGLELVRKDLDKIFEKYGIERIPTVGECFDPEVHEAVSVMEVEGVCEGTVVDEIKAGFKRDGRLIEPAKVVVAK